MTTSLEQLRRCSIAIDLGSARTRIYAKQQGLIADQPSTVAVNLSSGALMAVGEAAERMEGRTPPHISVVRPISNGFVVNMDMAQRMLRTLLGSTFRRAWGRRNRGLRIAATVPQGADPLARRAVTETLNQVGARWVELVDAPTAAGIGCGLPVEQPRASMVLVCGATRTQVAVLSLGAAVSAVTVPTGGETLRQAVVKFLRTQHRLTLSNQSTHPLQTVLLGGGDRGEPAELHGRDLATGFARTVRVDWADVRSAVQAPLAGLCEGLRDVLQDCPPDLVADLAERGMVLTGGSAQTPGLDKQLRESTGMGVQVADQPALSTVNGLAALLEGQVEPLRVEVP